MKILLALLCALQLLCILRAPDAYSPAAVTLKLAPGEALALGRRELAAPSADAEHLRLRRDGEGRWWVRNASAGKQLLRQTPAGEARTGSTQLARGDSFRIGAARFDVTMSGADGIALEGAGHAWRYDGATLLRDGRRQAACPGARLPVRAAALWNALMPRALHIGRPLVFGGNLYCDNRLGIEHVAPAAATIRRADDVLVLETGAGDDARMPLLLSTAHGVRDLALTEERLDGVTALFAGRTRFVVQADGDRLLLAPQRQVALYHEPRVLLPPQVAWYWQQRAWWTIPGGPGWIAAAAYALALGCAAALAWQRGAWPFDRATGRAARIAAAASALAAVAGVALLLLVRAGTPPGAGISVLVVCTALWCCALAPGRLGLAAAAGLLLIATGLLAQLELGLAAADSSMLRHFHKSAALLSVGLGAGNLVRLRLQAGAQPMAQPRLEWMLALLAAGALAGLLLQVAFGDETGVFDVQPVEFGKLALLLLTAHCLAVGLGWDGTRDPARARRWIRLGAPALLFAALMGLALVQVDDFSPLILLCVWMAAMVFAWSLASARYRAGAGVAAVALLAAVAIALLRNAGADQVSQWGFYPDRFLVWLDPVRHPHTGQQLLAAARAIAEGAWWGHDRLLGVASMGLPGSSALQIPAVQDDFAPSFFLNRHGLLAGLALWLLQALFLIGLLQTAARAYAAGRRARDFRQAWLARFRCFALCGGAAFVLGHFVLSWGTNLAIFPVMGQPMSFLSAGGSHLLFFICPLLMFSAISAQSLEESRDAGLCPT